MATAAADGEPQVPDDDTGLEEPQSQEPEDPWHDAQLPRGSRAGGGSWATDAEEYQQFLRFLNRDSRSRGRASRRRGDDDDDDDDEAGGGRSNAGPPPAWDGASPFKDYLVRARLWLATTKTKFYQSSFRIPWIPAHHGAPAQPGGGQATDELHPREAKPEGCEGVGEGSRDQP